MVKDASWKIDPQSEQQTRQAKERGEFKTEHEQQRDLPVRSMGSDALAADQPTEAFDKDTAGKIKGKGKGKGKGKDADPRVAYAPTGAAGGGMGPAATPSRGIAYDEEAGSASATKTDQPGRLRRTDEPTETESAVEQLSEEDRRKLVARLRSWAKEIHKRSDFRQGVHDLFDALEDFRRHVVGAAEAATSVIEAADPKSHRVQAQREAKRLLEQFAGGHSLEPTVQALRQLVRSTKDDRAFDKVRRRRPDGRLNAGGAGRPCAAGCGGVRAAR